MLSNKSQTGEQDMLTRSLTVFCGACFCSLVSFVTGNIQPSWLSTDEDTTKDKVCPLASINVTETQIKEEGANFLFKQQRLSLGSFI